MGFESWRKWEINNVLYVNINSNYKKASNIKL
jgi:hypothetical protein